MDARRRNRLVTIKAPPTAQDDAGQPTGDWTTVAGAIRANVNFLSGIENIKGGAQTSTGKASVNIAYRTGLNTAMRVELGSTIFQVTAVLPDEERKQFVNLTVEEIA